jgi:RNA polymerase sigma factor (sigma-70 family)
MIQSHESADAPPYDDAAAIQASWREPDRFAEIFHRYFPEIHRYIEKRLGADAADDLAAETFLAAFRGRKKFDPERGAVRPWLYGIATHRIGSHRRGERRHLAALARIQVDGIAQDHGDDVIGRVNAGEDRDALSAGLAGLPAADRDVLLLVAWQDLSYREVAQALGIPEGTVASRLNRARRKLRDALGGSIPHTR